MCIYAVKQELNSVSSNWQNIAYFRVLVSICLSYLLTFTLYHENPVIESTI